MAVQTRFRRPVLKFTILTYLLFWVMFGITGAAMQLGAPGWVVYLLPVICAWSPTFALLILFRKLYPESTLGSFIKQQFDSKLKPSCLLIPIGVQVLIFMVGAAIHASVNGTAWLSAMSTSFSVLALGFLDQLIRGPLGEELGWRGFMLNHLQTKYSPLASASILGVVWGFWHTPLWFITTGYSGLALVKYIALFLATIIALSIIITFFYSRSKNLIIPIVIHQLLNFLTSLAIKDVLEAFCYTAPLYVAFALVLMIVDYKRFSLKPEGSSQDRMPVS